MQKNMKFEWSEECEEEFKKLKTLIVGASTLKPFNTHCKNIICTDASNIGLGAVLMQCQQGIEVIIGCASRPLREAELMYSTIERKR